MEEITEIKDKIMDLLSEMLGMDVRDNPLSQEICTETMCLGTPADIAKLINAGYIDAMHGIMIQAVSLNGDATQISTTPMVQLYADENGCIMHQEGKCLLQATGMVPQTGRPGSSGCSRNCTNCTKTQKKVIAQWLEPENKATVDFCIDSYIAHKRKSDRNHTN